MHNGSVKAVVVGAGHRSLLYCGYMPDATVYYCPMYRECLPEKISTTTTGDGTPKQIMSLNSLEHVRMIGSSLKDWLRGDYEKAYSRHLDDTDYNDPETAMAWDSTYAYRMQPSFNSGQYCAEEPRGRYRHWIPHVLPLIAHENGGSALFKSQKLLGGRAVMTDHWNRQILTDADRTDATVRGALLRPRPRRGIQRALRRLERQMVWRFAAAHSLVAGIDVGNPSFARNKLIE